MMRTFGKEASSWATAYAVNAMLWTGAARPATQHATLSTPVRFLTSTIVTEKGKKRAVKRSTSPSSASSSGRSIATGNSKSSTTTTAFRSYSSAESKPNASETPKRKKTKAASATSASTAPKTPQPAAVEATEKAVQEEPAARILKPAPSPQLSQKKTPMVKSFRLEDISSQCDRSDAIFARKLATGGCQFFAWPGTALRVAASAITTMPDTIRTVHSVFGRDNTPTDIVMDIDCPVPEEFWTIEKAAAFQKKILDDTVGVVFEEIKKRGETVESQVVLQSPNLKKVSFHVHTRLQDVAFDDYRSVLGLLGPINAKIPYVDLQIYRMNGMLRMHSCMKENRTSPMHVYGQPNSTSSNETGASAASHNKSAAQNWSKWNILKGKSGVFISDEDAALFSLAIREPGTFSRLLHIDPPRGSFAEIISGTSTSFRSQSEGGSGLPFKPTLLPRTEKEAIENILKWMKNAQEIDVLEWRSWIAMGINAYHLAYHFRDSKAVGRSTMELFLEAWVDASRKCPQKFKPGMCENKWSTFDINKISRDRDWWKSYQYFSKLDR